MSENDNLTNINEAPEGVINKSESCWSRMRRSNLFRLAGGLLVLGIVVAVLALGMTRLLSPPEKFSAIALPYVQNFQDVNLKRWFAPAGVWSIRNETLVQTTNLDDPAQLFLPQPVAAEQPYHVSAYGTLSSRTREAGINFNAQYPNLTSQTHRVYIARTSTAASDAATNDMELVAGYTDEEGDFIRQVTVPFAAESDEFRFDLYVLGNTYLVQVNGQTLIENRPLFHPNGLVGLYTLGPATFDRLKITAAETIKPGNMVYTSDFEEELGGAGWVPFQGTWQIAQDAMVQADPSQQNAGIGYEGAAFEDYVLQTSLRHLIGTGGGVLFNMLSPYQINGAHVVRYSDQADALFWGHFDEQGVFVRQGFAAIEPPGSDSALLRVFANEESMSYDIYLNDQLIADGVPLQQANGHIGLITSQSSVAFDSVEVFPLFGGAPLSALKVDTPIVATSAPPTAVTAVAGGAGEEGTAVPTLSPLPRATPLPGDSTLIVVDGSTPIRSEFNRPLTDSGWQAVHGQWRTEDGALVQEDAREYDQSIVYRDRAFRNYDIESTFRHLDGKGAGLLFNMPFTDRLDGAHLVRYSDSADGGVFWGYFDLDGKFVGQGYATVDPPGDDPHKLRVVSEVDAYSVYLDDMLLVSGLPLRQNYGHIGLLTSLSAAAYDSVEVAGLSLDAPTTFGGRSSLDGRGVVSGEWAIEDGVYRQTLPEQTDYILNTGVYASVYRAETEITLPNLPNSGGGFVIHMPDSAQKAGAFIVRFVRGGEGIFWGRYDEAGRFQGRGSADIDKNPEGTYRLRLDVRSNRLDIYVDNELIAENVLMARTEGWIGLVAHGGPVIFRDVEVVVDLDANVGSLSGNAFEGVDGAAIEALPSTVAPTQIAPTDVVPEATDQPGGIILPTVTPAP